MRAIKNKKGFTLIELLAVIVILSIIILIAAQNIGGMTETARKNVLAIEGNDMVNAAKTAYQLAVLEEGITGSACFSMKYIYDHGLFEKGSGDDNYHGSVLIEPDSTGLHYTYTFWISNGKYSTGANGVKVGGTGKSFTKSTSEASSNCNSKSGVSVNPSIG